MGNLFGGGGSPKPDKLYGVKINSSQRGFPVPWGMGTVKVQQQVFWVDGFSSKKQSSGGKGGGKAGGSYIYSANAIMGLCSGPIRGLGTAWSGQSWLGSINAAESYTISGAGVYTPTNASNLAVDLGVGVSTAYSGSFNDYGSPSPTVLSGSDYTPMFKVQYGNTLASGQYSISPTGTYNFNTTTDAGKSVKINYSYVLTTINQQENDLITSGKTVAVGGTFAFASDHGVVYAAGVNQGKALTKVTGTPSVTGTYAVSGSAPATYKFATGDIGAEVTITFSVNNPGAVGAGESTTLNFTLNNGAIGQAPFSFLTASYPGASLGYSGIATLLYQPMDLGSSGEVQQNNFEVITPDIYGGGILDCNPVQCITRVLTDTVQGLGVGLMPFPTSVLDNGVNGTWGGASSTPGYRMSGSTVWNWFAANNFFISPLLDSQDTAASAMSKWLEAGMCAAFMSEGLFKLVPYGDTTTAANGVTWTAPSSYVVALDDTCFLAKDGAEPIKITRSAWQDAMNIIQVNWQNRANQYSSEITQESDQSLINRYGERREDPQDYNFIHTLPSATFAANMRLKHGSYIRNTFEFTLPFTYSYLEPMDIVLVSTTSVWAGGLNNANLGIVNLPIRITKVVDDPIHGLQITAEDYPFGAHQPTLYNKQLSLSEPIVDAFAQPGASEVVMFEATSRLTNFSGDQIWIGACGAGKDYGSTNVWVSQDGSTYKQIGTIDTAARLGVVASYMSVDTDPGTISVLEVQLAENCPPLEAGTSTDADNGNTLCFVDGEILSYSACSVIGQNTYMMSGYMRRGQMGTTIGAHVMNSLFLRLDDAVFKYTYDPNWRGQTLYFKFQSVNTFGNCAQPLSSLTPVTFTVPGSNPGTIDASTGLVSAQTVYYPGPIGVPRPAPIYPSHPTLWDMMPLQQNADVTANNTAAAIAGQGILATQNQVNGQNLVTNGDFELGTNANWVVNSTFPLTIVADATCGGGYKAVVNGYCTVLSDNLIPVNTNARYYVEARVKDGGLGSTFYLGFGCYDSNKIAIPVQPAGSTYNYNLALSITQPSVWTTYSGVISGVELQGNGSVAPNDSKQTNPSKFRYGTCYILPMVLANYGNHADSLQIDYFKIVQLPQYSDGTYVDDLKPAQAGADVTSQNADSLLQNPNFAAGSSGWSWGTGWSLANGAGIVSGSAYHAYVYSSTTLTSAISNNQSVPCAPGTTVSAACWINADSFASGTANVRITFRNYAGSPVLTATGNQVNVTMPWTQSRVVYTAPANAVTFTIECVANSITGGFSVCGFTGSILPNDLDDVPDGIDHLRVPTSVYGQFGNGMDLIGNLNMKNKDQANASTLNPTITSSWADLPELGSANPVMTMNNWGNPCLIGGNFTFYAATGSFGGGTTTYTLTGTGYNLSNAISYTASGAPTLTFSFSGDGSGASASVTWTSALVGPPGGQWTQYTPNFTFVAGSGYTHATCTVSVSVPSGTTYNGGASGTYTCPMTSTTTSGGTTGIANIQVNIRFLCNSTVILGPFMTMTDNLGNVQWNLFDVIQVPAGTNTFKVQAYRPGSTSTYSMFRNFKLLELG